MSYYLSRINECQHYTRLYTNDFQGCWLYLNCTYKTFLRTKWYWFQWFSSNVCRLALLKTIILLIFLCSIKSESFDGQYFQSYNSNFRQTWNIHLIKYKPLYVSFILISRFIFNTFLKSCNKLFYKWTIKYKKNCVWKTVLNK